MVVNRGAAQQAAMNMETESVITLVTRQINGCGGEGDENARSFLTVLLLVGSFF
jgi:hypothetical protein